MKFIETILKFFSKRKRKIDRPVVARFKVKVAGKEIVEVQLTGKTPIHVADLMNRLKESLDVRFKNGQYVTMKNIEEVFKASEGVFKEADKVFEQAEKLYKNHY